MLTYAGMQNLAWVWTEADPVGGWSVQESPDGLSGWTEFDETVGSNRTYTGVDPDVFVRLVGIDLLGQPVTDPSNVIFSS